MDNQQQSSRQDGGDMSDKQTDVTRSQNREASADASVKDTLVEGDNGHHGADETGSHQEGAYDKNHQRLAEDK